MLQCVSEMCIQVYSAFLCEMQCMLGMLGFETERGRVEGREE